MDPSEYPTGNPSPRRELQGPRPAPLKVRKDSYKISKKPPLAPAPAASHAPPPHHPQQRAPVIIYTVSPKVIHATPSDFMMLVQRLTGSSSSSAEPSTDPSLPSPSYGGGGALSPAARLATFEKAAATPRTPDGERSRPSGGGGVDAMAMDAAEDRVAQFPGILSPVPSGLLPISPNFFSPSFDPNAFLFDLSPALPNSKGFADSSFLNSPNNFLSTPIIPSPGAYWDLFNQFQDS